MIPSSAIACLLALKAEAPTTYRATWRKVYAPIWLKSRGRGA